MHTRFGAQIAESIFTLHFDCGRFDTCHIAVRLLHHLDFEAFAFAVAQVLAQQNAGPILGFRASCTCGDVNKTIGRVGRVAEHAAEFKVCNYLLIFSHFAFNCFKRVEVAFGLRHFNQFLRVANVGLHSVHGDYHAIEHLFFFAQFLRMFGIIPNIGVFQFGVNYRESFGLAVDVKDTSATGQRGRQGQSGR